MIIVPMAMKARRGCCRTVGAPLQRSDVQQHIVAVASLWVTDLQLFAPPEHAVVDGVIRRVTSMSPFLSVFVFWNAKRKIVIVTDIKRKNVSDKTYHACSTSCNFHFVCFSHTICIELITAFSFGLTVTYVTLIRAAHADTSYSHNRQ